MLKSGEAHHAQDSLDHYEDTRSVPTAVRRGPRVQSQDPVISPFPGNL